MTKGIIVAAPSSGNGKTLFTLALLRSLQKSNIKISSVKIGPDYIDSGFITFAGGKPCINLDTWAMRDTTINYLLGKIEQDSEFVVAEGVMGLFDGALIDDQSGNGSTASFAEKTGWPIILVIDASSQGQSIAALIKGFISFNENINICGVVFNKVGGEGHQKLLKETVSRYFPEIKVFGCLPREAELVLPERYLGLVQAEEHENLDKFLDYTSTWLTKFINIDSIVEAGTSREHLVQKPAAFYVSPMGQRIAVAKDKAFAFIYPSLIESWSNAGSEIFLFSPLAGQAPSKSADAIYLPGGYPELFAGELSVNGFPQHMTEAANKGAFIFGECGGYMVLGNVLIDADGVSHQMAGLLPLETSLQNRKLTLGYRRVSALSNFLFGVKGAMFNGHEFHYATTLEAKGKASLFSCSNAAGEQMGDVGMANGRVSGSFIHLIDLLNK